MLERSAKLLKPKGGDILYSTCSLSPIENDEVTRRKSRNFSIGVQVRLDLLNPKHCVIPVYAQTVEKFLKRFKGQAKAVELFDEIPSFVKVVDFVPPEGTVETRKEVGEEDLKASDSNDDFKFVLEKTKHGFLMLPDKSGFGPLYICKLRVTRL